MTKLLLTSAALGTALFLSACGSDQNGEQDQTVAAEADETDANNPFASSERQMSERMMAAVGTDAGDTWVRMMIEHHQGAIDMSRLMLEQNPSEQVAMMAQDIIDKQTREIADLRKLIKDGTPDQESAELYSPAMMSMQQAMRAATGADVEETFMRKMLAHHEGGVTLSDVALQNGAAGEVRSRAAMTRADQQKEAEMVQAMISGEPMPEEEATAVTAPAPAPAARASAAPTRPRPQAPPAPAETPDPHAGMNMSDD